MATPTEHAKREYEVFLRGPADVNTFAFGTVDAYRSSVQHLGLLSIIPEPVDNPLNDFGIQEGGGFTVEIVDDAATSWYWLWPDGTRITLEDGSGSWILEG